MKIAFLHPDLGLGGAERLVVDAAAGLAARGHDVTVFTSHFEPGRAFAECSSGAFRVVVAGDFLPRSLGGGFHVAAALARNAWLGAYAATAARDADVFVADQVAACVPLLRVARPAAGTLFYCHFPDKALSPRGGRLKAAYRAPFDALEEACTGLADAVLVNSRFTLGVVLRAFPSLPGPPPAVLYPAVELGPAPRERARPRAGAGAPLLFLSINRFERKKGLRLAIDAFALLLAAPPPGAPEMHLVLAGGYDPRVAENVEHYRELVAAAAAAGLLGAREEIAGDVDDAAGGGGGGGGGGGNDGGRAAAAALARVLPGGWPDAAAPPPAGRRSFPPLVGRSVTFVRSFTDAQKGALLAAAGAVLYTPEGEHFGIVPIECGAAGRPVVAVASGGPLESVVHGKTGVLCEPTPAAFAAAMRALAADPARAAAMGAAGRAHVAARFSRDAFAAELERACAGVAAVARGARAGRARAPRARQWAMLAGALAALLAAALLGVAVVLGGAGVAASHWLQRRGG